MRFRTWIESEASLNSGFPEVYPNVNRGAATVASDEVLRTGLQPQVDSQEIHTKQKDEQDKIQAIDATIQRADVEFPQGSSDSQKVSEFKKLWDSLKEKWHNLKVQKESPAELDTNGLGSARDDEFTQMMQRNPNMSLTTPDQQMATHRTFSVG